MKLAIIDTETTGFSPENDNIIEVGIIQYSVKHSTILRQYSTLVPVEENPVENINKIPVEAAKDTGFHLEPFWEILLESDILVGHKVNFDLSFLSQYNHDVLRMKALCTMSDFTFPRSKCKKLTEIALDHGIPVWNPHRALTDCKLIVDVLSCYSSDELYRLISEASEPKTLYVSLEEKPGSLSKASGFTWNKIVPRYWAKWCRSSELKEFPFRCIEWVGEYNSD